MTREEWRDWANDYGTQGFLDWMKEQIATATEDLKGQSDFAEYKRRDGYLAALEAVVDEIKLARKEEETNA